MAHSNKQREMTTELFKDYVSEHKPTDEPTVLVNGQWLGLISYDISAGTCKVAKLHYGGRPLEITDVFEVKISEVENVLSF